MPSITTSRPNKPVDRAETEILLSAHQVVAYYHALRLRANGLRVTRLDPVTLLNRRTGRRWTAKRWVEIFKPYYESITAPTP